MAPETTVQGVLFVNQDVKFDRKNYIFAVDGKPCMNSSSIGSTEATFNCNRTGS